jgi:hypothetical protein
MLSHVLSRERRRHLALSQLHERKQQSRAAASRSSRGSSSRGAASAASTPVGLGRPATHSPAARIAMVPPPPGSPHISRLDPGSLRAVPLNRAPSGSTYFDRCALLVERLRLRLAQHAGEALKGGRGKGRLGSGRREFEEAAMWTKLLGCLARFSHEAGE